MATGTVAVLQSSYIPWKGYFDIIHDADLFVFYDDVQFTKQDWRSRNRVKSQRGSQWLTLPVGSAIDRLICEVRLSDPRWAGKHYKTLAQCYSRCEHFAELRPFLEETYLARSWTSLSELNQFMIRHIARELLGIRSEFADSRSLQLQGSASERLLDLLRQLGAKRYISGPAARAYLDPESFGTAGIEVVYKDYSGYPEYPQRFPPFDHQVTVLDLLCNVGLAASPWYIWDWRSGAARP
jgi:hypothetical protein